MLTSKWSPADWSSSVLKRVLLAPLVPVPSTALVMAFWGPSGLSEGAFVLAVKPCSPSGASPDVDAVQLAPGVVGVVVVAAVLVVVAAVLVVAVVVVVAAAVVVVLGAIVVVAAAVVVVEMAP